MRHISTSFSRMVVAEEASGKAGGLKILEPLKGAWKYFADHSVALWVLECLERKRSTTITLSTRTDTKAGFMQSSMKVMLLDI